MQCFRVGYRGICHASLVFSVYTPAFRRVCMRRKYNWQVACSTVSHENYSPLFKQTNILKLSDLIKFQISIFMYKFHKNQLPAVFDSYFLSISKVHNYSTRLSSTHAYALPKARTNYGKFRIKFIGAKVWNALDADLKTLSFRTFKARLKENFTLNYQIKQLNKHLCLVLIVNH